ALFRFAIGVCPREFALRGQVDFHLRMAAYEPAAGLELRPAPPGDVFVVIFEIVRIVLHQGVTPWDYRRSETMGCTQKGRGSPVDPRPRPVGKLPAVEG